MDALEQLLEAVRPQGPNVVADARRGTMRASFLGNGELPLYQDPTTTAHEHGWSPGEQNHAGSRIHRASAQGVALPFTKFGKYIPQE